MGLNNEFLERNLNRLIDDPYDIYAELSNYLKVNVTKTLCQNELLCLSSLMYDLNKKLSDYCSLGFYNKGFLISKACNNYLNAAVFAEHIAHGVWDLEWIDEWISCHKKSKSSDVAKTYFKASYRCYDIYRESGDEEALYKGLEICKKAVQYDFDNFNQDRESYLFMHVMLLIDLNQALFKLKFDESLLNTNYEFAKKASELMIQTKRKSDLTKQAGFFRKWYGHEVEDSEIIREGFDLLDKGFELLRSHR